MLNFRKETEKTKNQRIAQILEGLFPTLEPLLIHDETVPKRTDLETQNSKIGIELTKYVRLEGKQEIGISIEKCKSGLIKTLSNGGYIGTLTAKGKNLLRKQKTKSFMDRHRKTLSDSSSSEVITIKKICEANSPYLSINGFNCDWVGVDPNEVLEILKKKQKKYDSEYSHADYEETWLVIHSPEKNTYDSMGKLDAVDPKTCKIITENKGPFNKIILLNERTKIYLIL